MPRRDNAKRYEEIAEYVIHRKYHPNSTSVSNRCRDRQFARNFVAGNDGALYLARNGQKNLWIQKKEDIVNILNEAHLRGREAHYGQRSMSRYLKDRSVYWLTRTEDVKKTIRNCPVCSKKRAPICRKAGKGTETQIGELNAKEDLRPVVRRVDMDHVVKVKEEGEQQEEPYPLRVERSEYRPTTGDTKEHVGYFVTPSGGDVFVFDADPVHTFQNIWGQQVSTYAGYPEVKEEL